MCDCIQQLEKEAAFEMAAELGRAGIKTPHKPPTFKHVAIGVAHSERLFSEIIGPYKKDVRSLVAREWSKTVVHTYCFNCGEKL